MELYKKIIRPIFFKFDPERIHVMAVKLLGLASRFRVVFWLLKKYCFVSGSSLKTKIGGIVLENPVGLAAGFDKDITAPLAYPMLGFGFAELGSVTYQAQRGNPRPRLWRLPKDGSLIVHYGLCNCGAKTSKERLNRLNQQARPIGISIAPTTGLALSQMADDYIKTFLELFGLADYIVLNVSCPNVENCEQTEQIVFIEELLEKIGVLKAELNIKKDLFIKISPEMEKINLDKLISLCLKYQFTGIVATNLIKKRKNLPEHHSSEIELDHLGGVSGKLLQVRSDETVKYIYQKSQGKLKIIGVGGIFTADDAYAKIKNGASAVQLITGFIYDGPLAIRKINRGLVELLKKEGFGNISEAVGVNVR